MLDINVEPFRSIEYFCQLFSKTDNTIARILSTKLCGKSLLSKDVVDALNAIATNLETKKVSNIRQDVTVDAALTDSLF